MRSLSIVARTLALASVLAPAALLGQAQTLSITNYQFVSEERFSRSQSYVTYRADLVNVGNARSAVTATVSTTTPNVSIVPGQTNLHFSPVPGNSTTHSLNTFIILVDRTVDFNFASLSWS